MLHQVPTLDLSDFLCNDLPRKKRFVKDLGNAFEDIGFVVVKGHEFSEGDRVELYEQVKNFFSLPEEVKMRYHLADLAGQRGFTPFGREHAKGHEAPDLKEFWQWGQPHPPLERREEEYPKNPMVEELPMYNPMSIRAYKTLERIGRDVLRAIALYLELEEDHFETPVHGGQSILRAIHYPPIKNDPGDSLRAAEHEDINLITLLMGASAEGLEVLDRSGAWVPVHAQPGELVINVGDMLQRLTNGKLRSTTHRVINPQGEKRNEARFSIPFFMHPISEMPLNVLTNCVSEDNPSLYEDITAGEYLDQRLREIGLK